MDYMERFKSELREFLNESPVAVLGDWGGFSVKTERISKIVMDKFWLIQDTIQDVKKHKISIYKCKNTDDYVMGTWGVEDDSRKREVFIVITQLKILKRNDLKNMYTNPIQMSKVETEVSFRGKGYTKLLYSWFIFNNYTLISDMIQFDGARKLYDSLSRERNIIADVIDDQERKVLKHNVRIDSGSEDWDFDNEIWDYSFDKAHIRIALYKK